MIRAVSVWPTGSWHLAASFVFGQSTMLFPCTDSFDVIWHFGTALVSFIFILRVCISFSVDFCFFMHWELFARELTDDTLMATLLNSSVLEVYGWQLYRAIELGSADLWETKVTVNEMRNSEDDGEWSYTLLVEAESDHNVMAPVPQAACLQPGVREQRVLADVRVNVPAVVSSLLLRTLTSVITSLDHFIPLNTSSDMHFIQFCCFTSSYLNGFIPATVPYYSTSILPISMVLFN